MTDWQAIKAEYITTHTSYRKLAWKYGVPYQAICRRSREEGWVAARKQHTEKTACDAYAPLCSERAEEMARVDDLADKLLEKLEKAITELDSHIIVHKSKMKTEDGEETTEYKEAVAGGVVDRQGLKQIASALKDIKEVKMLRSALDQQEQEARIAALRQKSMTGDSAQDDTGVILLPPRREAGNDG